MAARVGKALVTPGLCVNGVWVRECWLVLHHLFGNSK